ncbi:hypothetical protein P7C70_g6651, partial [Phenoliferia sp. Uapishka_3]
MRRSCIVHSDFPTSDPGVNVTHGRIASRHGGHGVVIRAVLPFKSQAVQVTTQPPPTNAPNSPPPQDIKYLIAQSATQVPLLLASLKAHRVRTLFSAGRKEERAGQYIALRGGKATQEEVQAGLTKRTAARSKCVERIWILPQHFHLQMVRGLRTVCRDLREVEAGMQGWGMMLPSFCEVLDSVLLTTTVISLPPPPSLPLLLDLPVLANPSPSLPLPPLGFSPPSLLPPPVASTSRPTACDPSPPPRSHLPPAPGPPPAIKRLP